MAGNLHAIDIEKGRQKWQFQAADHIHSTPSLSGNKVLFGCDSGKVYAVDCESGKPAWETAAAAKSDLPSHPRRGFSAALMPMYGAWRSTPQALDPGTGRPDLFDCLGETTLPSAAATASLLPRLVRQNGVEHFNGNGTIPPAVAGNRC
jgi:outer membrane protein assembly factor BamB